MCKFQQPQIPANVTADERRAIYFDALYSLDLRDKVEKYNDLSYLSWANAWAEFKWCYPSTIYRIIKNPETNLPYFVDSQIGIMVYTEVTVDGITHEMWLPVMNNANKSMKLEPYTYKVFDKFKKEYVEKTVEAATMFDINKTIMRCLVKNLAMFGLGLFIYAGEDFPESEPSDIRQQTDAPKKTTRRTKAIPQTQQATDKYAGIKAALNACGDQQSLMSLYQQHKNEVDGNSEIKALFTERKLQLQKAA